MGRNQKAQGLWLAAASRRRRYAQSHGKLCRVLQDIEEWNDTYPYPVTGDQPEEKSDAHQPVL